MLSSILSVVVGFILWSVLWVGSNAVLTALSPDWYGEKAKNYDASVLLISLVRSVIFSLIAGFVAALIVGENYGTPIFILGALLFAFGVFVQAQLWKSIPLWYHLAFLILLIPVVLPGGKLYELTR